MSALSLAKLRAARRSQGHGGTMFVVAMTVAVLASLGVWAIQSAALEVRMAGYERQSTQTHYLAEYGILGAMQNLSPGYMQEWLSVALCGPNGNQRETCLSAPWSSADPGASQSGKACHRWSNAAAVTSQYQPSGTTPLDGADAGVPGSLGITTMQGDFNVEMTEITNGPAIQGNSMNGPNGTAANVFYWVTLQSDGKTQQALSGSNYTAYYGSEGDEQLRSRVRVGPTAPINMANCPQ